MEGESSHELSSKLFNAHCRLRVSEYRFHHFRYESFEVMMQALRARL
jgi:hypothetical protein